MAADGFRGDYPYAGVTVVAENRIPEDNSSALIAVETVRDVFAEGVAFGVEDALRDSLLEAAGIICDKKLSGCSAAAIAFSGTHLWYSIAGNCRLYKIDSDLVNEDNCTLRTSHSSCELPERLTHEPRLKTHMTVAHFTLNLSTGDECSN